MNIYKVVGKRNWEYWLAENEEDAKQKFLEYFKGEIIISCTFQAKVEDVLFRAMSNGLVMRF